MLNLLLIRVLALELLWVFQISIQIITISDFEDILMILGFNIRTTSLKNVVVLENSFNIVWYNMCVSGFRQIRNANNLQIWFRLRQFWGLNLISFNAWCVFDILLDGLEIWGGSNVISCNNDSFTVCTNIIYHNVRFDILENSVDVEHMHAWVLDEVICTNVIHWNNDLFVQRAFSGHVDLQFGLILTAYDFLDNFNFFALKVWESLFDF